MLALSEVKQRHYGGLLVLAGIPAEDLLDELLILFVEFEGYRGIIFGGVAVLEDMSEGCGRVHDGTPCAYHLERGTSRCARDLERPPLLLDAAAAQRSRGASEGPWGEFGGHGEVCE